MTCLSWSNQPATAKTSRNRFAPTPSSASNTLCFSSVEPLHISIYMMVVSGWWSEFHNPSSLPRSLLRSVNTSCYSLHDQHPGSVLPRPRKRSPQTIRRNASHRHRHLELRDLPPLHFNEQHSFVLNRAALSVAQLMVHPSQNYFSFIL